MPHPLRIQVKEELDKLTKLGIIKPIQFVEWAAPIAALLKSDKKSILICGDFKLTINSASKVDRYPVPKITIDDEVVRSSQSSIYADNTQ